MAEGVRRVLQVLHSIIDLLKVARYEGLWSLFLNGEKLSQHLLNVLTV